MSIELSPTDAMILHTSVERIAGLLTASIAHHQRDDARALADLYQVAVNEDIQRIREILSAKGVALKTLAPRPNVSRLGAVSVRDALLPSDPLEDMARIIDGSDGAAA